MPSCECCWEVAVGRAVHGGGSAPDLYHVVMREHEDRGCPCTGDDEVGRKLRAGQFWDDERKVDARLEPKTENPLSEETAMNRFEETEAAIEVANQAVEDGDFLRAQTEATLAVAKAALAVAEELNLSRLGVTT